MIPPKPPRSYFTTEFHGGARAVRARLDGLYRGGKGRATLLLALVLAFAALAGGLVACSPAPGRAVIAMITQYYDDRGSVLEIPLIQEDDSAAAQAVNAAILERKALYQRYMDDPYRDGTSCLVRACPFTTDRYLSLVLWEDSSPSYGSDGEIYAWVYDKERRAQLTLDEALAMAGVTRADLMAAVAEELNSGDFPLPLDENTFEVRGFRMRPGDRVEFYLRGANQDGAEGMDSWWGLYAWTDGTIARVGSSLDSTLPTDGADELDPPLWYQWGPSGGKPQGGYTDTSSFLASQEEFQAQLTDVVLPALYPQEDGAAPFTFTLYLSAVLHAGGEDCWSYDVSVERDGQFYDNTTLLWGRDSGRLYRVDPDSSAYLEVTVSEDGTVAIEEAPDFPEEFYGSGPLWNEIERRAVLLMKEHGLSYDQVAQPLPAPVLTARYPELLDSGVGVGVYRAPITLSGRPDWTDPAPYMVFAKDLGGFWYLGSLESEAAARDAGTIRAMAEVWQRAMEEYLSDLPAVVGEDRYDAGGGFYYSSDWDFRLAVSPSVRGLVLFRPTGRGVAVYDRYAYQYYLAMGGREEGAETAPGSGLLFEILAWTGPEVFDLGGSLTQWCPASLEEGGYAYQKEEGRAASNGLWYCCTMDTLCYPTDALLDNYFALESEYLYQTLAPGPF